MAIVLVQGVVFAYAGVELVGTAAGETANPKKIMPRAINSVVFRIAVFYCGSVLLLALLLPSSAYSGEREPVRHLLLAHRRPASSARSPARS